MAYDIYKVQSRNQIEENKGSKEKYWTVLNQKNALIKFNKYDDTRDILGTFCYRRRI